MLLVVCFYDFLKLNSDSFAKRRTLVKVSTSSHLEPLASIFSSVITLCLRGIIGEVCILGEPFKFALAIKRFIHTATLI